MSSWDRPFTVDTGGQPDAGYPVEGGSTGERHNDVQETASSGASALGVPFFAWYSGYRVRAIFGGSCPSWLYSRW